MMDCSLLGDAKTPADPDYNTAITEGVARMAHWATGRPGHSMLLTDRDQAVDFVARTGVDALAIANLTASRWNAWCWPATKAATSPKKGSKSCARPRNGANRWRPTRCLGQHHLQLHLNRHVGFHPDRVRILRSRKADDAVHSRLNAFDSTRGFETVMMSFIVTRPAPEPPFHMRRRQSDGRLQRYARDARK